MKVDVLVGMQWGDEGKGKIVDFLTPHYDVIARFQGGPNAGHTLEFDGCKHVLHTIPSGIFHPATTNVIGNGVIIDPVVFRREIEALKKRDLHPEENLLISKRAHLILPSHLLLDAVLERSKGDAKIGSTLKGIGPAYTDKISRNGIRVGDISNASFMNRYDENKRHHIQIASIYCDHPLNTLLHEKSFDEYEKQWIEALEVLKMYRFIDSEYYINQCLKSGKRILAEGAQGTLLDVDFGSYPYVTSSNTITAGVCSGLGVAPKSIGKVFGVFKAYCTRVGSGPFPTELPDKTGEYLRDHGHEYGSTTGRPRRCGWLDLPALKYAIMLNGISHLLMMKADVLNELPEIKLCTSYKTGDELSDQLTFEALEQKITPTYKSFKGWRTSLDGLIQYDQLPNALKTYVGYIEEECGVRIALISTGPDRNKTIVRGLLP
ncbi:MAG: adenylosuccinate synthase [Bacteroidales bacterium]|nr:adenylosuccinate synthase [Bacteroidales bacterium]MDZ4203972.1 adenylosuccinate synthase [Bacteroidales bacterium]